MPFQKLPGGTRGGRNAPGFVGRVIMPLMMRIHRRAGDTFGGLDLLYLSTVGARSGQRRTSPVARFEDGDSWLVVASAAGAVRHPAWYHNIAAHPDQVWAEVSGVRHQVEVEQLEGAARDQAWELVTRQAPRFNDYLAKTDRPFPILRLTPVDRPGS